MSDQDSLSTRGRALEDEYFRKKDRELVEKMRHAAAADAARRDMDARTGLRDPVLLQELLDLGFTPDTVSLLPLVPLLQVAWAEGGVSDGERHVLETFARARGIAPGSAADRQLVGWTKTRPDSSVFERAGRLIRAMLDTGGDQPGHLSADELVRYCETIAAASGGLFGIGRISPEERQLLSTIAQDFKGARG